MKRETIEKAVALARGLKHMLLATADSHGMPHIAASGRITVESDTGIGISQWFCPHTLANLQTNPRISVAVWDPETDTGYQILGECEKVEDLSVMDGYSPDMEKKAPPPQVERKIVVHVHQVLRFSHAPHSDVEEE